MLETGVGQGEIREDITNDLPIVFHTDEIQTLIIFLDFTFTTRFHISVPIRGWVAGTDNWRLITDNYFFRR